MKYTTCGHQRAESASWRCSDYRALLPRADPPYPQNTMALSWLFGLLIAGKVARFLVRHRFRVWETGWWDVDAHVCDHQEISYLVEKREQVLETSVLHPPFNPNFFQKGFEAAHKNT